MYEVFRQFVEFSAGQGQVEVFRARSVGRDERQVDVRRENRRQFDFRFFSSFLQALFRHLIRREVDARLALEFADHPVHDGIVEVVAAEVGIAVGSFNFEDAVAQFEDRYVECTAAEVEYEDLAFAALIEAVGKSSCRRFVDDTEYVEAGNLTGVLRSLTLGVVEVSRYRDDRLGYFFAQIAFGVGFQFLQNHSGNLLGRVFFAVDVDGVAFAHVTFNRRNRVFRVGNGLAFCQLAYEAFACLGKADDRRRQTRTFCIRDDGRFAAFHNSYNRVCRT